MVTENKQALLQAGTPPAPLALRFEATMPKIQPVQPLPTPVEPPLPVPVEPPLPAPVEPPLPAPVEPPLPAPEPKP